MTETTEPKHDHATTRPVQGGVPGIASTGLLPVRAEACQACQTEALRRIEAGLTDLDEGSAARRAELLDWFKNVDVRASTLPAFVGFANAIGCATTYKWSEAYHEVLPLLTFELVFSDDRLPAHLEALVGTDEQYAIAEFKRRFA